MKTEPSLQSTVSVFGIHRVHSVRNAVTAWITAHPEVIGHQRNAKSSGRMAGHPDAIPAPQTQMRLFFETSRRCWRLEVTCPWVLFAATRRRSVQRNLAALRLLRFRRLDGHPCSDVFAIGCNIIIDRSNGSIRDPLVGHPAEPNHPVSPSTSSRSFAIFCGPQML